MVIGGIFLILTGCMIGAICGVFRRIANSKTVVGEIVSIEPSKTLEAGEWVYYAYVEYYVDGAPYIIKSKYMSSSFRTGKKLCVVYNQTLPQQAAIRPDIGTYITVIGCIVAGIVMCCLTFFE